MQVAAHFLEAVRRSHSEARFFREAAERIVYYSALGVADRGQILSLSYSLKAEFLTSFEIKQWHSGWLNRLPSPLLLSTWVSQMWAMILPSLTAFAQLLL